MQVWGFWSMQFEKHERGRCLTTLDVSQEGFSPLLGANEGFDIFLVNGLVLMRNIMIAK
jgi:hypothetical protein